MRRSLRRSRSSRASSYLFSRCALDYRIARESAVELTERSLTLADLPSSFSPRAEPSLCPRSPVPSRRQSARHSFKNVAPPLASSPHPSRRHCAACKEHVSRVSRHSGGLHFVRRRRRTGVSQRASERTLPRAFRNNARAAARIFYARALAQEERLAEKSSARRSSPPDVSHALLTERRERERDG